MLGKAEMCMKRLIKEKGSKCWSGERERPLKVWYCLSRYRGNFVLYIYISIYIPSNQYYVTLFQ